MNFFESELTKIMEKSDILKDRKYVGRNCYGTISGELRAKVEFVTLGVSGNYAGLKTSIINRKEGMVDSMILRFADVWGKPKVDNTNFRDGVEPHIWTDKGKSNWYAFHPAEKDYQKLAGSVEKYLSIFQDMGMEQVLDNGSQHMGF